MPSSSKSRKPAPKRRLDFGENAADPITVEDDEPRSSGQKKNSRQTLIAATPSSETPTKKRAKTAIVTPSESSSSGEKDSQKEDVFVPKYIHKNVGYHTEGDAALPESTKTAFSLICETHTIPKDLQSSRRHGPLSGSSYEERVLQKYSLGLLEPKPEYSEDEEATKICVACATQGHVRDECPSLV